LLLQKGNSLHSKVPPHFIYSYLRYPVWVIALAIPAAFMDLELKKNIDDIGSDMNKLRSRVAQLEKENKSLKEEVEADIQKHVMALERRLRILEEKLGER